MKRVLYIGGPGVNQDLLQKAMKLTGKAECIAVDDAGLGTCPSADLAIIDCIPSDAFHFFEQLATRVPRCLCMPPLGVNQGRADLFLRLAKRHAFPVFPLATIPFNPGLATVLEVMATGVLGELVEVTYRRTGEWPFFPRTRGGEGKRTSCYWDLSILAEINTALLDKIADGCSGDSGNIAISVDGIDCRFQVEPGGDYCLEIEISGETGKLKHKQRISERGICEWSVEIECPDSRSRQREGKFCLEAPLALEVCRVLAEERPGLTKREVKQMVMFDRKITARQR